MNFPKIISTASRFAAFTVVGAIALWLSACSTPATKDKMDVSALPKATPEQIEALVERFIEAKEGETIEIAEGLYDMNTQLILDKVNKVTIKGAGMYNTVLSFKNIKTGGEGMKIAGDGVTLQDFTVMDAPGDCIKTQHCNDITFRAVNTTWTHQDLAKNGTYGIYPVQCKNVLVEKCEVSHSRDAGIYVGQSENIIVRDNYVFENVAGIEIENSDNAEVYNNITENNTGGILVFNLPGLPKAFGSRTKVYNNTIKENNHDNFAVPIGGPNGNAVTMIPPGSGIVILAGNDVEIFNNKLINHKTYSIAIASYHITDLPIPTHPGWSPFTTNVSVHDNTFERTMGVPDLTKDMGKLVAAKCFKSQDVLYDGIIDETKGKDPTKNPMNICVKEKQSDLRFSRFLIPASGEISKIEVFNDVQNFNNCTVNVKTDVGAVGK
ncbi:MAG: right-handed parallel beta-helix repeat-containing protein [Spirosomaceae bacterium]|jgi:parallel beta-helix repeat protein|nr:right-handed parallel beta-helix repeat-containing protein [Spirosomataceae bacterium]